MRVIISGASGLIGTALGASLRSDGHEVVALVRRPAGAGEIRWDPTNGVLAADALDGADAVVHLAGAGIGDHRWTDDYKRELIDSRVKSTTLLATTIAASANPPKVLLSGSAIGIYGASDGRDLDESSPAGTGFLADVCVQWEAATAPAAAAGVRVVHLRTGIVLTPKGGALKKMLPLFKLFAGGKFGNGKQWQSWISLADEVGAIRHLLTHDVRGPVNLTAPAPVTNAEFTKVLGGVLHRPTLLPVPRFGPALLLGGELADALLYTGQKVLPGALRASGYSFQHTTLDAALRFELGK
ncbi:MAG: TIGR01777 family oxidoreductase [Actinomycetota bacterium]|nr:TIGR01777 family oxidoreductase [Actinomycetota bacterium]